MTDEKIEEVTRPLNSVCKVLDYGEAVVSEVLLVSLFLRLKDLEKIKRNKI